MIKLLSYHSGGKVEEDGVNASSESIPGVYSKQYLPVSNKVSLYVCCKSKVDKHYGQYMCIIMTSQCSEKLTLYSWIVNEVFSYH